MNIFEVSDRDGDTLSIELEEEPIGAGSRFMATVDNAGTTQIVSVLFGDDAARALIKALRQALPPEQAEQTITLPEGFAEHFGLDREYLVRNNTGRDEPVAPTYKPKRADYIRQAIQILRDHNIEPDAIDVLHLAYFLAGER